MAKTYKGYLPLIIIGLLAAAFILAALSMLIFNLQPAMTSTNTNEQKVNIMLYEGETANGQFGFGFTADNLTSPGPTLRYTTSGTVTITIMNVGKLPHGFALTTRPDQGATLLFNAEIGADANPLQPGNESSVTFTPNTLAFSYWYISPVQGDASKGMYGAVEVTSVSGPAFP